jgi:hypothetical protein
MSRGPQTFKQRDVAAAIRAVVAAGREVERIEIHRDGSIIVILTNGKEHRVENSVWGDEWDDLK